MSYFRYSQKLTFQLVNVVADAALDLWRTAESNWIPIDNSSVASKTVPVFLISASRFTEIIGRDNRVLLARDVSHDGNLYHVYRNPDRGAVAIVGENPRDWASREYILMSLLEKLSSPPFNENLWNSLVEDMAEEVDEINLSLPNNVLEKCMDHLRDMEIKINFSEDNIKNLFPDRYLNIRYCRDTKDIYVITNICKFRYEGATYEFGPYEIKIPTGIPMSRGTDKSGFSSVYKGILFRLYNRPQEFLEEGCNRILTTCKQNKDVGRYFIHPHLDRQDKNGWSRPCLGNYVDPINKFYADGDLYRMLLYLSMFLHSLSESWYSQPDTFQYCGDKSLWYQGKCNECPLTSGDLLGPVRDYKVTKLEDYKCTIGSIAQPNEDRPIPWDDRTPQTERGHSHDFLYQTPFAAEDFIDGYDPDGFNDRGFNRDGFDRSGLDRDGRDILGFDALGFDRSGYDRDGFNRQGIDRDGYDREGYDRYGFNRERLDRDGNPEPEVNPEDPFFTEDDRDFLRNLGLVRNAEGAIEDYREDSNGLRNVDWDRVFQIYEDSGSNVFRDVIFRNNLPYKRITVGEDEYVIPLELPSDFHEVLERINADDSTEEEENTTTTGMALPRATPGTDTPMNYQDIPF